MSCRSYYWFIFFRKQYLSDQ